HMPGLPHQRVSDVPDREADVRRRGRDSEEVPRCVTAETGAVRYSAYVSLNKKSRTGCVMPRNRERDSSLLKRTRSAFCSVLMAAGLAPPVLRAADGPPVVAKPDAKVPVTITDNGKTFTLANGIVTATINKRTGDLDSLVFKGVETMGHEQGRSGYWEQDPSA